MEIKDKYYLFTPKEKKEVASATSPDGTKLAHELIEDVKELNKLPFQFVLKKVTVKDKGITKSDDLSNIEEIWLDYQINNLVWPMFSLKLKRLLEKHMTGHENISWISVIINGNEEQREYFIPKFSKKLDVLDFDKTLLVPNTDHIIKPYFSLNKISNFSIFNEPSMFWEITSSIYVRGDIKRVMEKEGVTGISFEEALVV